MAIVDLMQVTNPIMNIYAGWYVAVGLEVCLFLGT